MFNVTAELKEQQMETLFEMSEIERWKVSAKIMNRNHNCTLDGIKNVCHGRAKVYGKQEVFNKLSIGGHRGKQNMKKTDKVTATFEDGTVMEYEAQQLRNLLNASLRKPRIKGTGFCPTLDCDEEGFVKEIENSFPEIKASETIKSTIEHPWYPSKKCPRCRKEHKYPIHLKFRPISSQRDSEDQQFEEQPRIIDYVW